MPGPEERAVPLVTYCVEYAPSQRSTCQECDKVIPTASLRFGKMERKDKKQKKHLAKHSWWHFKCFEVPDVLTKIPLEMFRGYPAIREKDQLRVSRLVGLGRGGNWRRFLDKDKSKKPVRDLVAADDASGKPRTSGNAPEKPKNSKRAAEDASEEHRKKIRRADGAQDGSVKAAPKPRNEEQQKRKRSGGADESSEDDDNVDVSRQLTGLWSAPAVGQESRQSKKRKSERSAVAVGKGVSAETAAQVALLAKSIQNQRERGSDVMSKLKAKLRGTPAASRRAHAPQAAVVEGNGEKKAATENGAKRKEEKKKSGAVAAVPHGMSKSIAKSLRAEMEKVDAQRARKETKRLQKKLQKGGRGGAAARGGGAGGRRPGGRGRARR